MSMASPGDVLELGPGTFRGPGNRDLDPGSAGKADLTFRGRLGPQATVLDLEGAGRAFSFSALAGNAVVQGLTLVNGSCAGYPLSERRGGGIAVLKANVTLRDLVLRYMDCSSDSVVFGGPYSGGAIYLNDAASSLQQLVITDSSANHGGAIACWGTDLSMVEDSTFERNFGKFWGGTLLTDENSRTSFRRCSFSFGTSPYGGHIDDGGKSAATFTKCSFDYGYASLSGGACFGYGQTTLVFTDCSFSHNWRELNGGAVLLSEPSRPYFIGVNFTNNSAFSGGAVRSTYSGVAGPVLFQQVRFISNIALGFGTCTAQITGWMTFEEAYFGGNTGSGICTGSMPGHGLVVRSSSFVGNVAEGGGAILAMAEFSGAEPAPLLLQNVTFDSNVASGSTSQAGGGAVLVTGVFSVTVVNCTFINNSAKTIGGAMLVSFAATPGVLPVVVNNSVFTGNTASMGGGSLYMGSSGQPMSFLMSRSTVSGSSTFGDGGGAVLDCATLVLLESKFLNNSAPEGNGGGITLGLAATCGPGSTLRNVDFKGNSALLAGGAMYFSHGTTSSPPCAVPTLAGNANVWNPQASSAWSWTDFTTSVSKNVARIGPLQATSPVRLQVACAGPASFSGLGECSSESDGVALRGFLGMPIGLTVQLQDAFNQLDLDDTKTVEVVLPTAVPGITLFLNGPRKFRMDNGTASLWDASLGASSFPASVLNVQLLIRVPRAIMSLLPVPGVLVNLTLGTAEGQCPAGFVPGDSRGGLTCLSCPSGNFAPRGAATCSVCPTGRFASVQGSSMCTVCPVGFGCPAGTSVPAPCAVGTAQGLLGQELCEPCEQGFYQPATGQQKCLQCPPGTSTQLKGASQLADCVCQQGSFMMAKSSTCSPCTQGMECPTGATVPGQAAGFYVQLGNTSADAFRCAPNQCLVGAAGTCAQGREGFVCSRCQPGYYPITGGPCTACRASDVLPVIASVVAAILLVGFLVFLARSDISKQKLSVLSAVCILGQTLVALQMLTMINRVQVPWPGLVKSILDVVAFLRFDFGPLRYQCIVGQDTPLMSFIFQLLAFPAGVLVLLAISFGLWICRQPVSRDDICNSTGQLITLCFLPATVMAVTPFDCTENPNGSSSISKFPAIQCGTALHHSLVVVGVVATLCYTGAVLCAIGSVTFFYPRIVARGGAPTLLRRFRFLFYRYKPSEYYYGFLLLLRSTLITLIPLMARTGTEVLGFSSVIAGFSLLQCTLQPWRTTAANISDAILSLLLVVLLVAAGSLQEHDPASLSSVVAFVLVALLLVLVSPIVVLVLLAVKTLRDRRNGKRYTLFLSHHKGGAASLARYFKHLSEHRAGVEAFLDSDELQDLDLLLDAVRSDTQHLVLLLTSETMRRPWCAGEIVVAHKCNVPTVVVTFGPATLMKEDELGSLENTWTPEQIHQLQVMGLSMDDIRDAYRCLGQQEVFELPSEFTSSADLTNFHEAVGRVLQTCGLKSLTRNPTHQQVVHTVIVANCMDVDAVAGALLLQEMVQQEEHLDVCLCLNAEEVKQVVSAEAMIAFLTPDCLESKDFVAAALGAMAAVPRDKILCVQGHPGFRHPALEGLPAHARRLAADLGLDDAEPLLQCFQRMVSLISIPFSPGLNKQTLGAEVSLLCKRLRASSLRKLTSRISLLSDPNSQPSLPLRAVSPSEDAMGTVSPSEDAMGTESDCLRVSI